MVRPGPLHLSPHQRVLVHASGWLLLASGLAWLAVHYLAGAGAGELPHPMEVWTIVRASIPQERTSSSPMDRFIFSRIFSVMQGPSPTAARSIHRPNESFKPWRHGPAAK